MIAAAHALATSQACSIGHPSCSRFFNFHGSFLSAVIFVIRHASVHVSIFVLQLSSCPSILPTLQYMLCWYNLISSSMTCDSNFKVCCITGQAPVAVKLTMCLLAAQRRGLTWGPCQLHPSWGHGGLSTRYDCLLFRRYTCITCAVPCCCYSPRLRCQISHASNLWVSYQPALLLSLVPLHRCAIICKHVTAAAAAAAAA